MKEHAYIVANGGHILGHIRTAISQRGSCDHLESRFGLADYTHFESYLFGIYNYCLSLTLGKPGELFKDS